MTPRSLTGLALADFRERVRRPAFLIAALTTVVLGYLAAPPASADYAVVKVGQFRGVYDSAYLGTMLATAGALWLSLCGFFVVKNAIARDTETGVGELLAATPTRSLAYVLGKFSSNLLVLAALAGVLAVTAPVTQLLRGESGTVDLVALWLPFVVLCLPVLSLSAAAALLFESVPLLRGGLGNIAWFFGFPLVFLLGFGTGAVGAVGESMQADLRAQHPEVTDTAISVGLTGDEGGLGRFVWSGLELDASLLAAQLGYVALAVAIAALPALWFHRFDPARADLHRAPLREALGLPGAAPHARRQPASPAPGGSGVAPGVPGTGTFASSTLPRAPVRLGGRFGALLAGEVRLLLRGRSSWWWLGVLAVTGVALLVPRENVATVLLAAWIWPVLVWSRLGTQAHEHSVHSLLAAAPMPRRQLLAEWGAGAVVAALTGIGPLLRMVLAGDAAGAAAWGGGAVFIPALALLLGSLSRSTRLFQFVYLGLWYAILNNVAAMDVMGAVREGAGPAGPHPALVLGAGAALLAAAALVQHLRHARR